MDDELIETPSIEAPAESVPISGPVPSNVEPPMEAKPKRPRKPKEPKTGNIPKKSSSKPKAPQGMAISAEELAPGYALLVGGIHDMLATRLGEHWRLSALESTQIGNALGTITATLLPFVDAKWLMVGMSMTQIVGIEMAHAMAAPAKPAVPEGAQAVQTHKPARSNVSYLDPATEPVGTPEPAVAHG